ncbi:hypothetical protein OROMI_029279 [Orobanche minor]
MGHLLLLSLLLCAKTKQPQRCLSLLESSDALSKTAALPVLGEIAIAAARGVAGEVRDGLHSRFLSATEPGLKNIYGVIEDLFHNIHVMLVLAADDLQKRNYGHLASKGGGVRDYADRSAAAIEKDAPELKQKNEDVGVWGEAVAKDLL